MKKPRWGIVTFPGSNCDQDMVDAIAFLGLAEPVAIWHKDSMLKDIDLVVLPGGFSYGDYLRSGAIARFSPIMDAVLRHANAGKPVLGICNGFQILTEAGLLPGALRQNPSQRFISQSVYLRVDNGDTPITCAYKAQEVISLPIAHGEGCYTIDDPQLLELEGNNQVIFRYASKDGNATDESNPNGSKYHIAGICNKEKNVFGMMPHPERAVDPKLGHPFGRPLFEGLAQNWPG